MSETDSLISIENEKIKQWIYPMFFSTASGPKKIKIVNSISVEPKNIKTISNETQISYFNVKYNIALLEQKEFLIKINKKYVISEKFKKNYNVLHEIIDSSISENSDKV